MFRSFISAIALSIVLVSPGVATGAEITVWTTRAIATVLAEIGGEFERATGHRLIITADLPPAFLRRVQAGERFDLLITGSAPIDEWIRDGRIVATTRTEIARSGIGVEVRAGRPKPDISTVDAFTRALLNAKSIAYLKVGSGLHLEAVLERLGISKAIASKVIRPDADIVSELVAKGEVEIGMVVITMAACYLPARVGDRSGAGASPGMNPGSQARPGSGGLARRLHGQASFPAAN